MTKKSPHAEESTIDPMGQIVPRVRLSFAHESQKHGSEFGRGIAQLCLGIQECGSLNAAAKEIGMAYSKAWRIVKDTEEVLGFSLVQSHGPRGSSLTAEGKKLLDAYLTMVKQLDDIAPQLFSDCMR